MAGSTNVCAPQLVAWAWLPGNAPTGYIAPASFGISCNKNANAGQWECFMANPVNLTDGSAMIMFGPGVPSDSNSGVIIALGDNGVGNIELTIRSIDTGAADNTQGASFMIWKLPRLT